MSERFIRTRRLLGGQAMETLKTNVNSLSELVHVFDNDTVAESNINRQIISTTETIGRLKVDAIKERALLINPDIKVNAHNCFYMPDNADNYDLSKYSYIVDAIDTVTAKIELIKRAKAVNVPIISSMGTGNKLEASSLQVADIKKTEMCPLARTMRRELKSRGITSLKVVYSKEKPIVPDDGDRTPASVAFVPAAAGFIIAGEVIKDLIKNSHN